MSEKKLSLTHAIIPKTKRNYPVIKTANISSILLAIQMFNCFRIRLLVLISRFVCMCVCVLVFNSICMIFPSIKYAFFLLK